MISTPKNELEIEKDTGGGSFLRRPVKQFDWSSIKQRLRDGDAAMDRAWVANEAKLEQVLRQRLLDYASRKTATATVTDTRRVLGFHLSGQRYAVDLSAVVKVFPLSQCTPVPGAPKEIVGIINVNGEIRSVVDAAELLGIPPNRDRSATSVPGNQVSLEKRVPLLACPAVPRIAWRSLLDKPTVAPEGQVMLLRHANLEVGLRVDHVESIETITADSLSRPEAAADAPSMRYVEGVTPDSLIVLSLRQLTSHPVFQSEHVEIKGT